MFIYTVFFLFIYDYSATILFYAELIITAKMIMVFENINMERKMHWIPVLIYFIHNNRSILYFICDYNIFTIKSIYKCIKIHCIATLSNDTYMN